MAQESWEGDAEDYTATLVTVDDEPEPKVHRLVLEISDEELQQRLPEQGHNAQAVIRDYGYVVSEG